MKQAILGVLLASVSAFSHAVWINATGKVTNIITYATKETILVKISTNGIGVGECSNKEAFAISASISPEARARMYSMLLAAQATDKEITLSYRDAGGCEPWDSDPNVYRIITRLQ